jgi:hypothetical protein
MLNIPPGRTAAAGSQGDDAAHRGNKSVGSFYRNARVTIAARNPITRCATAWHTRCIIEGSWPRAQACAAIDQPSYGGVP